MGKEINDVFETSIYEDNGGGINAIVEQAGTVVNVIANLDLARDMTGRYMTGEEIITEAKEGFQFADDYDSENFCGHDMLSVVEEIKSVDNLVVKVIGNKVVFYPEKMGMEAKWLFGSMQEEQE